MATEKLILTSPRGKIKFPTTRIAEKEYSFLKAAKPPEETEQQWKFSVVFDPKTPQAKELLAVLSKEQAKIKGVNFQAFSPDKSKNDDGEIVENGMVKINFTSGYPLKMVDSQLKPCFIDLYWGADVVVKFHIKEVNNKGKVGIGRYPVLIQVITPGGGSVDTSGLEPIDDGYSASDAPATVAEGWED